ncbi:MAG: hypothetical protein ACTHY8_10740 [Microbacterium gubbeenense]|uniref:hypothetical protein n=2 Tax=Microbacterium gubbeenense TaxID=159896 RepID=UPI003F979831
MTNDTLAPPTPPSPEGPPPQQSSTTRSGTRALAITIGVLGGGILLLAGATTAIGAIGSTMFSATGGSGSATLPVNGVSSLKVDVGAGDVDVAFGSGSEARLDYESTRGEWTFERDGDDLVVSSPQQQWFGFFNWGGEQRATLVLPESLEGIDADLDVSAGSLAVDGTLGEVVYELSAGEIELEGTATSLEGDMSAGRSIIELADLRTVTLQVSAGGLYGDLRGGDAPDAIDIDVAAGSVEMQVPDVPYRMVIDRAAGSVETNLQEARDARRTIDVEVAAGNVTFSAG